MGEVIWINGAFSSGKTTVARILVGELEQAFLLDPETIGTVLQQHLVPPQLYPGDYQDLELWRLFTREAVRDAAVGFDGFVVVPMTVAHPRYFAEIIDPIRDVVTVYHFTLMVSKETILRREATRPDNTGGWAALTVDRVLPALANERYAVHLDADSADAASIASTILNSVTGTNRHT